MQNVNNWLQERRSHFPKEFTGLKLEDEVIEQCLNNANYAPSHKLTKPWRFEVMRGQQVANFFGMCADDYQMNTEHIDQKKLQKIALMAEKTSHVIGVKCAFSGMVPPWEEIAATAMAVQNIYLSLAQYEHAVGYWSTGLHTNEGAQRNWWKCAENEQHLGFFVLGHVAVKRRLVQR